MKRFLTVLMIAVLLAVSMATVTTAYASEEIVKLVHLSRRLLHARHRMLLMRSMRLRGPKSELKLSRSSLI